MLQSRSSCSPDISRPAGADLDLATRPKLAAIRLVQPKRQLAAAINDVNRSIGPPRVLAAAAGLLCVVSCPTEDSIDAAALADDRIPDVSRVGSYIIWPHSFASACLHPVYQWQIDCPLCMDIANSRIQTLFGTVPPVWYWYDNINI